MSMQDIRHWMRLIRIDRGMNQASELFEEIFL